MKKDIWLMICAWAISVLSPEVVGKHIPSFAGPYKIVFRKCTAKEGNSTNDITVDLHHNHYKPGQDQYFWGTVSHKVPLDDTLKVNIDMAVWANNQWKKNAFVVKLARGCTDLVTRGGTMSYWMHGEEGTRCPIRKGTWTLKNGTYDMRFPDVKVFPYGRYLFRLAWQKKNQNLGFVLADVDVIPRL